MTGYRLELGRISMAIKPADAEIKIDCKISYLEEAATLTRADFAGS
jgi:hypothetical protein